MKEYVTKDIANIVGIAPPTVRKYAQILEKEGYSFTKNEKGFRIFIDTDIEIFRRIFQESNDTGRNVSSIASTIVKEQKSDTNKRIQTVSLYASDRENAVNLSDTIHSNDQLMKEIQELKQLVLKHQEYIDSRLKSMDQRLIERDARLTKSLRATLEVKQAQLEVVASKQKKWYQFWGNK